MFSTCEVREVILLLQKNAFSLNGKKILLVQVFLSTWFHTEEHCEENICVLYLCLCFYFIYLFK